MSTQPPRKPAARPIGTPISSEIDTDTTPASSEARVPQITRDSTSRPISSVPNQCSAEGALRIAPQLVAMGSRRDPRRAQRQHDEAETMASPSSAEHGGGAGGARRAATGRPAGWVGRGDGGRRAGRRPWRDQLPQARVDRDVRDVGQQVQQHVGRGRDQHHALHHRVVAVEHRIDDQLAEAGDGEHLLGEHRAGQQRAEFQRAERDDGRQRVAQRVLEDHRASPTGPWRARCARSRPTAPAASRCACAASAPRRWRCPARRPA
jgi:hypothetical protein